MVMRREGATNHKPRRKKSSSPVKFSRSIFFWYVLGVKIYHYIGSDSRGLLFIQNGISN